MLQVKNLTVAFTGQTILDSINFHIEEGDWLMIIGSNGAGKTTITNAISQSLPYTGEILYKGTDIKEMRSKDRAEKIGVLMQNHMVSYGFKVKEIVEMGRYAYSKDFLSTISDEDENMVEYALEKTGLKKLKNQSVLKLSGGELQRTFLAQLIAQNPSLMILDEPTNHLDISYQEQTFNLIRDWLKEGNRAVISVVHDLRLARMYGNKALLLKEGKIMFAGKMEEVMQQDVLKQGYGVDVYDWQKRLNKNWN
ncbi:ABC transporter ATP-binding protein [Peptoniphilus sp. KCTC 25270]|uniref:ABC transporter ATP-binding protein n=1 Tax=Peptoniphilus sp. KCTC 25270 TaxID=2897414 RepID=UPI001E4EDA1B|nr:ABC transporter ATP-binding protein [Peptoniphilus sp. KCTC 25270]MCD1146599.1 ABC transporter ATP-binding protein [Peptoniphilus sp. KCTC 25270]